MEKEFEVVTLCGSTRFKDEFLAVQEKLTLEGKIVISVGLFGHADGIELTEETKTMLDRMHKRKIDMADTVYIINQDGYIGSSTKSEIAYAFFSRKQFRALRAKGDIRLFAPIAAVTDDCQQMILSTREDPNYDLLCEVFEKYGFYLNEIPGITTLMTKLCERYGFTSEETLRIVSLLNTQD